MSSPNARKNVYDEQAVRARLEALMVGSTLSAFAAELEVNYQDIQRYLNGAEPRASFLAALAVKKNVSPLWFLTGVLPERIGPIKDSFVQAYAASAIPACLELQKNQRVNITISVSSAPQ
jgi:transcriptional regulator with XRE-family HTH domain